MGRLERLDERVREALGEEMRPRIVGDEVEVPRVDLGAAQGKRGAARQPPLDVHAADAPQQLLERVVPPRRPQSSRLEDEFLEVLCEPRVRPEDFGRVDGERAPEARAFAREPELDERRLELAGNLLDDEARTVDPGFQGSYVSRSGSPSRERQRVSAAWSCSGSPMSSHSPWKT